MTRSSDTKSHAAEQRAPRAHGKHVGSRIPARDGMIRLSRCAVVCVDQVESTHRLEELGAEAGFAEQHGLSRTMASGSRLFGGQVCGWRGDGAIVRFRDISAAITAAHHLVASAANVPRPVGTRPMTMRASVSVGSVLLDDHGNIYGRALVVAVRLNEVARPNRILACADVAGDRKAQHAFVFLRAEDVPIPGLGRVIEAAEVVCPR